MRSRLTVSTVVIGVALLGTACGSDESASEETTQPSVDSSTTTTVTTTTVAPTTTSSTTTTTLPTTSTESPVPDGPAETWLEEVRTVEDAIVEADQGWIPWTAGFEDAELLELQSIWCEQVGTYGDIEIENSPEWLSGHPIISILNDMLPVDALGTPEQSGYTTDLVLPFQLRFGACPGLQPQYDEIELMAEVTIELLAITDDGLIEIPDTNDELGQQTIAWVFATCTNIDTSSPDRIAALLVGDDFDVAEARRVIASMRTAESYLCPGRSAGKIQEWADAGYPLPSDS